MKTFTTMAAQGDFIIFRRDSLPDNLERIEPEDGKIIIAHSETGHNHVMEAETVEAYKPANTKNVNLYELFLLVKEPTEIQHLRSYDTHEPILVPSGIYEIRRQREFAFKSIRRVND